jgi:hypothetical protein
VSNEHSTAGGGKIECPDGHLRSNVGKVECQDRYLRIGMALGFHLSVELATRRPMVVAFGVETDTQCIVAMPLSVKMHAPWSGIESPAGHSKVSGRVLDCRTGR